MRSRQSWLTDNSDAAIERDFDSRVEAKQTETSMGLYPNRDENEPLGYRLELVEAIPLEPKACFRECSHSDEIANTGPTAVPITAGQFGND